MDKTQEEQEIEKKISQYQNRQKILLNKKRTEEHRARTHRLIGRGAIWRLFSLPLSAWRARKSRHS